jgi:predicted Zn-dependent peptidase
MRVILTSALALMICLASPQVGAAKKATSSTITPETFRVERHVLQNGLVVLTHEDHSVPAIAFWQWYKVGSRNERPGITGISHFFEHMMFNGSKNIPPKEYDRILESNGGYSNAFTDRDMTAYFEEIASDRLEIALRLDSDRMAALSLLPEQLKSEIEVVKEERRLRTDNDIGGMLDEQLWAVAFNAAPYRWPVIGWMGDLNRITREEMVEYFRIHYAPDNCILVLTGDCETKSALALIEKYFGGIPRQPAPQEPVNSEPEQRGERRAQVHYPAQDVTFQIGYHAPSVRSADIYVLDLLATILGRGESSRLYQTLVYDKQSALAASADFGTHLDPSLFTVAVEMKPDRSAAEGETAVDSLLQRLVADGPTERELTKAKNYIEADFVRRLTTNNGAGGQLGFYEYIFGDYRAMFAALGKYRSVTAADCKRVAKEVFDPLKRTVVELVPEKEAGAAP